MSSRSRDGRSRRRLIVCLRLAAIAAATISVPLIWKGMSRLPWEIDAVIAVAAAFAWTYKFERESR